MIVLSTTVPKKVYQVLEDAAVAAGMSISSVVLRIVYNTHREEIEELREDEVFRAALEAARSSKEVSVGRIVRRFGGRLRLMKRPPSMKVRRVVLRNNPGDDRECHAIALLVRKAYDLQSASQALLYGLSGVISQLNRLKTNEAVKLVLDEVL